MFLGKVKTGEFVIKLYQLSFSFDNIFFLQKMRHLVFATDSRGSKLKKVIWRKKNHLTFIVTILWLFVLVANFQKLVKTKVDSIMRIDKLITIWILLAGGICNLTSKLTQSGGTEIQYIRSDQNLNVQSVILQFRDFLNYFQSIC